MELKEAFKSLKEHNPDESDTAFRAALALKEKLERTGGFYQADPIEMNARFNYEFAVRNWGEWETPYEAEDEEDYDWQQLSNRSWNLLGDIIDEIKRRFNVKIRAQAGEKNWLYFEVESNLDEALDEGEDLYTITGYGSISNQKDSAHDLGSAKERAGKMLKDRFIKRVDVSHLGNVVWTKRNLAFAEATNDSLKITNIRINDRWLYDTQRGGIAVAANVNGVDMVFPFMPFFQYAPKGMDCDECVLTTMDKYGMYDHSASRISHIAEGGGYRTYALAIWERVLKSKPKQNQKDFRFTGQYYSTEPIKAEFKNQLQRLYNEGALTDKFLKAIGLERQPIDEAKEDVPDTHEEQMDFLAKDEDEAINGYEEVIAKTDNEHLAAELEHIKDEEEAHKAFLEIAKEDPDATYEHPEHEEEETLEEDTVKQGNK